MDRGKEKLVRCLSLDEETLQSGGKKKAIWISAEKKKFQVENVSKCTGLQRQDQRTENYKALYKEQMIKV